MLPSVATRLRWIEEDAAGFVRLLEGGQKTGIADMRRWAKRAQFVCHTVLAEPAPPSLGRLVDLFVGAKDRPRSRRKNPEKFRAAVRFVAENPQANPYQIMRAIGYEQRTVVKRWLADPEFKAAVEQENKFLRE
jgi:hypothetical protein